MKEGHPIRSTASTPFPCRSAVGTGSTRGATGLERTRRSRHRSKNWLSPVVFPEERLFPQILPGPLPVVVALLRAHKTWDEMYRHLPDWEPAFLPNA
jgi:hypothetical protein